MKFRKKEIAWERFSRFLEKKDKAKDIQLLIALLISLPLIWASSSMIQ
jgi:hypothetical protein